MAAFCPCPKYLPEDKLKGLGLMVLSEEMSRQPTIDCATRLLVVTLMQICNKKKLCKQGKTQNAQLEEKRSICKVTELSPVLKEIKSLEPDVKWNKGSEIKVSARALQLSFQLTCEKESLSSEGRHH